MLKTLVHYAAVILCNNFEPRQEVGELQVQGIFNFLE